MSQNEKPHPSNAPGPFYVVDGCCTACGVPLAAAPALFAYDRKDHCYVRRQPHTSADTEAALQAVRGAELHCIRYRGSDPGILQRFAELDELDLCDAPEARGYRPILRNHVTFEAVAKDPAGWQPMDLGQAFAGYLRSLTAPVEYRLEEPHVDGPDCILSVGWYEERFHVVGFRRGGEEPSRWLGWHRGNLGVSELMDRWLRSDSRFSGIRWYAGMPSAVAAWRETPW